MADDGPGDTVPAASRTSARLQGLYQDLLLEHYRRPRNKGEVAAPDAAATVANPLCGDSITVALRRTPDGRVESATFTGQGCSIAQASASMMTELVTGCGPEELRALRGRVDALLAGDAEAANDSDIGDLRALAGVARFPARFRCATLPWEALAIAAAALAPHP